MLDRYGYATQRVPEPGTAMADADVGAPGHGVLRVALDAHGPFGAYGNGAAIALSGAPVAALGDALIALAVERAERGTPIFVVATALDAPPGAPTPPLGAGVMDGLRARAAANGAIVIPIAPRRMLRCLALDASLFDALAEIVDGTHPELVEPATR